MIKKENKTAMKISFMCTDIVYSTVGNPVKMEGDLVSGQK